MHKVDDGRRFRTEFLNPVTSDQSTSAVDNEIKTRLK